MNILQEDYDLIQKRINELKQDLKNLATEFNDVLNQSSETWHDNAPYDMAKSQEAVYLSELERLQNVIKSSRIYLPDPKSPLGHFHKLNFNGRDIAIFLAGDFTLRNGQIVKGHTVVTTDSPIAQQLFKDSLN